MPNSVTSIGQVVHCAIDEKLLGDFNIKGTKTVLDFLSKYPSVTILVSLWLD
jgi:hypothetical protein